MDDPEDSRFTLSFDLLYHGLEITTGGQRIHDYQEQMDKLEARKMNAELFESFTMLHKYGMPPHGGLGIGLTLCRSIITAHGGEIWEVNHPDGGAQFLFTLPLEEEEK